MSQPFSILVVCVGNICRSPLAERLLRRRFDDLLGEQSDQITVSSAGARALVGSAMNPVAESELVRLGGVSDGFAARQLLERSVNHADLVLTATRDLRSRVLEEAPGALRRTFTLREFAVLVEGRAAESPAALVAGASKRRSSAQVDDYDVPDPIGRSAQVHREVADLIAATVGPIADSLASARRGLSGLSAR